MIIYKTINHTVKRRHNVANGSDYTLPARSSASIILVTEGQGDQVKVVFLFQILHKKHSMEKNHCNPIAIFLLEGK